MQQKAKLTGISTIAAPSTIGFRLDPESNRVLVERAAVLGVSPHELARIYVCEVLQEPVERAAMREAAIEIFSVLTQFRQDFAFSVEAMLISAGKVSQSQAQDWVEEHLNRNAEEPKE